MNVDAAARAGYTFVFGSPLKLQVFSAVASELKNTVGRQAALLYVFLGRGGGKGGLIPSVITY